MTAPFRGRRVLLLGLGHFGGQTAAARWLTEQGAQVVVTDKKPARDVPDGVAALRGLSGIKLALQDDGSGQVADCSLVVASPAVPHDAAALQEARRLGIPVTSELALFLDACQAPLLGVTGSNGKTTTAHMLAALLGKGGHPLPVGGNAGGGSLSLLPLKKPDQPVVLELSSFMLASLPPTLGSLSGAIFTNLTSNHLDRHGSLEAYARAKGRILDHLQEGAPLACPAGDRIIASLVARSGKHFKLGEVSLAGPVREGVFLDQDEILLAPLETKPRLLFKRGDLSLKGQAALFDAMAAAWLALKLGAGPVALRHRLHAFKGLPHRLEEVARAGDQIFINDSASTTLESTLAAVLAFPERPVDLLLGGASKGPQNPSLLRDIAARCRRIHLHGATASTLQTRLECVSESSARLTLCGTLGEAFRAAARTLEPDAVVLFSPGHASYDAFPHFEARGEAFRALVKHWLLRAGASQATPPSVR